MITKIVKTINRALIRACKRVVSLNTYSLNDDGLVYDSAHYSKRTLPDIVYNVLQNNAFTGVKLLQIGAHDGSSNNLLSVCALSTLPNSECILIEPNPAVFSKLQQMFVSNTRVQCLNVAVDVVNQVRKFYAVECSTDLPEWATQLSSFDIEQIRRFKDRVPDIEEHVTEIDVTCLTFERIITLFTSRQIDILLIDVEGYDGEIIRSIPFHSICPLVIVFEHTHLDKIDLKSAIRILQKQNYQISTTNDDVVAFKMSC